MRENKIAHEVKDAKIIDLSNKIEFLNNNKQLYEEELSIVRNALTDKGKGTEFMQKIVEDKDKII